VSAEPGGVLGVPVIIDQLVAVLHSEFVAPVQRTVPAPNAVVVDERMSVRRKKAVTFFIVALY
jgi:hypothetical protein